MTISSSGIFRRLPAVFVLLLLGVGENPKIVAERLGHSSVRQTLDTYSHVAPTNASERNGQAEPVVVPSLENREGRRRLTAKLISRHDLTRPRGRM
jgi:hypothetical protein